MVDPAKAWAVGMTQEQFFHEFVRRNPGGDVIPVLEEWLDIPAPIQTGIDGVNPEDINNLYDGTDYEKKIVVESEKLIAEAASKGETITDHRKLIFECSGCGKKIKSKVGLYSHQHACEKWLSKKD